MAHIYNINLPLAGGGGGIDTSKDTVTPEVLEKGYTAHDKDGNPITGTLDTEAILADGVEAGKKSEHDAFWDNAQELGNRTNYSYFLSGIRYPTEILKKPKYPIVLEGQIPEFMMDFNTPRTAYGGSIGASAIDMSSWSIDASGLTQAISFFRRCSVVNFYVDLSNVTNATYMFNNGSGDAPSDKITVKISEKCTTLNGAFHYQNLSSSTDVVRFAEGSVIAAGDLNLWKTNQSKEGIISTVNALSNATSGLSVGFGLNNVNKAFETSEGANDGSTSEEWLNLVATKPNWTIRLSD